MKTYRIFVCDMGKFRDSANYEFVAEFADGEVASQYCMYMRGKRRYTGKDILIKEVSDNQTIRASAGVVSRVISVLGEYIPVEECEFV